MTIDTPFPERPATPFWDPRGRMGSDPRGMGDFTTANGQPCDPGLMGPIACQDSAARILNAITAGTMAATQTLTGPSSYASCPPGLIFNPATLTCQPGVGVQASASGSGMLLLLIAGVALFFMARGR